MLHKVMPGVSEGEMLELPVVAWAATKRRQRFVLPLTVVKAACGKKG
jgi:hypothetical protein